MKKEKMLTTKEVAERIGVKYTTVMLWLRENKLDGAIKETSPRGDYWLIPESSIEGIEKRGQGRPKKQPQTENSVAKLAVKKGTPATKKGTQPLPVEQPAAMTKTKAKAKKKGGAAK